MSLNDELPDNIKINQWELKIMDQQNKVLTVSKQDWGYQHEPVFMFSINAEKSYLVASFTAREVKHVKEMLELMLDGVL